MESIPQYFILTALAITKGGLQRCDLTNIPYVTLIKPDYGSVECGEGKWNYSMKEGDFYQLLGDSQNLMGMYVPMNAWFRFTYYISLVSCTFGILRFLDAGITRILDRDGWRNYVGYGIAFFSVIHSLHTKALGLGVGGAMMRIVFDPTGFGK